MCVCVCVCVLVLKWEALKVNTRLGYYNKLRECRELVFSLCDVGRGVEGKVLVFERSLRFYH